MALIAHASSIAIKCKSVYLSWLHLSESIINYVHGVLSIDGATKTITTSKIVKTTFPLHIASVLQSKLYGPRTALTMNNLGVSST